MDQLVKRGVLDYTRKNKRWVLLLVALGFSSYGTYKVYNFPSIARKRRRISMIFGALVSMAEAISDSADTIGVVSRDFRDFLQSDSDQIPNSLKQISKIARSNEFSESVVTLTQALTMGILKAYQSNPGIDGEVGANSNCPSFLEKVFDKLSTPAGTGLVSTVVGSFARNMVMGFYQNSNSEINGGGAASENVGVEMDSVSKWVDVVCDDKCKSLLGDCIHLFVSTAVSVYLDKTMDINTYDEMFAGMTNPKHEKKVSDVLVSVCNGAIESLVKTSHQVLTSTDSNSSPDGSYYSAIGQEDEAFEKQSKGISSFDEVKDDEGGWVSKVSSTLAVPSNRRLVLDLTGRVTFETVKSLLEFLLEKLCEAIRRCVDIFHEVVIDNSLGIVRYATAKSSVIATICLSVCLRILEGPWVLAPAHEC